MSEPYNMCCVIKYLTVVKIYTLLYAYCVSAESSAALSWRDAKTVELGSETILTVMLLSWTTFVTVVLLLTCNRNPFGLS